jgi:DNA modification methylase
VVLPALEEAVSRYTLHHGDCREVMATLDAESVDAVVSDPPYGLSFMGKGWDHGVPGVEFWAEALRVAKPGAHLLAFGGTRTYHRLACAIEDAGWEIRDCVMWVYGSGFPKSHDVSKAIDKMDASEEQERRRRRFTAWVRSTGITSRQIDEATGTNMGGHYTTAASQPAIMTREHLEQCRHLLGDVPEWVERESDIRSVESKAFASREVLSTQEMRDTKEVRISCSASAAGYDAAARAMVPITAPATDAARQWSGWGTALKPAYEPVIVARKPLVGTVAENVLTHGTGAINVDGCRVGTFTPAPAAGGMERLNAANHRQGYRPNAYQKTVLTGQRLSGTTTESRRDLSWVREKSLCDSCANLVESAAKLAIPATKESSAENPAGQTTSEKAETARDAIVKGRTGCCAGLFPAEPATDQNGDSSLSTGESGKKPTARSRRGAKSTTSTATAPTTDSKTCSACGCSITAQGTNESTLPSQTATPNTRSEQESAGPSGRWPSNFIHDGSEEVVGLFPETTSGSRKAGRHLVAGGQGRYGLFSEGDLPEIVGDSGSAARFFYCAKASKADRDEGCEELEAIHRANGNKWTDQDYRVANGKRPPSAESGPRRNHHPTVKPTDLMRYLCRLVTPPGGIVLDPFAGSGSTGKAAVAEGFQFIGIEQQAEYVEIARARIAAVAADRPLLEAIA